MRSVMAVLLSIVAVAAGADDPAASARTAMQAGNYAEAYCLWRGLADRGDAEAQFNLGWLYHNGEGLVIDDREAVRWWEKAAAQNHADALTALGSLYRLGGRDLPKDPARAIDYFVRAAERGDDESALLLRSLIARHDAAVGDRAAELLTQHAAALGTALSVDVDNAILRQVPAKDAKALATIARGARVVELSHRSGWTQAGDPATGAIGWIKSSQLKPD
jgi:TPR repeat protein